MRLKGIVLMPMVGFHVIPPPHSYPACTITFGSVIEPAINGSRRAPVVDGDGCGDP